MADNAGRGIDLRRRSSRRWAVVVIDATWLVLRHHTVGVVASHGWSRGRDMVGVVALHD